MKSHNKKTLSWANARIFATTGAIIILAICAFSCNSDTKTKAPGDQEKADTVAAEKTLAELRDFEVDNYKELIRRYPLGWAYFVVDPEKKEIVSKGETGLSTDFRIDWSKARVGDITPERIILQLPDIFYKSEENNIVDQMVNFPRGVGTSPEVDFSPEGLDMWIQMLVDHKERPVVLMGFKVEQLTGDE
jgi:hypothetical protein